jgi:hypothetical protein
LPMPLLLLLSDTNSVAPFSPCVMITCADDDTTLRTSCCDHVSVSTSERNKCTRLLSPACSTTTQQHEPQDTVSTDAPDYSVWYPTVNNGSPAAGVHHATNSQQRSCWCCL